MAKRQRKQNDESLTIIVRHVATPDAKQRLCRVANILLKASAKSTIVEEEKLPRRSPREEWLTGSKLSEAVKGEQNA